MPATAQRPRRSAPPSPYPGRHQRLHALLAPFDTQTILITNPLDVGYLTGFFGGESYLLVRAGARPLIISDFRYEEELEPTRAIADILIRRHGMNDAVAAALSDAGITRCAIQAEHLTVADHTALSDKSGVTLVPTTNLVQQLRVIKDQSEIALIKKAIRIQEEALLAVLPSLRRGKGVGKTELEVAARLESEMKSRGSSKPGFESIVAARANGSLPHYRPGAVKLAANRPLLIDWGATYNAYQGDMTRTFSLGSWPRRLREVYAIVLEAQEMAAAALAPGKTAHQIDAIARSHITKAGYGEMFGHGLGHGLGLSKEPPMLNPLYPDRPLAAGMVTTVEPGIYLPGVGGVRIEDQYVIRADGAENLCTLPKDIQWATL